MCASSARQTGSCWQDEGNFPRCTYRIPLHQKIAPYIISCCGPRICKGGIFLCKKAQDDLFSRIFESSREFKKVTTITTCAMFGALSVVLGYYSFKITPNLKIGFGSIPNMLVDYLFGPVVGGSIRRRYGCDQVYVKAGRRIYAGLYVQRDACGVYLRPVLL